MARPGDPQAPAGGRAAAPFDVVRALRERTAGIAPQYHDRPR